MSIDLSEFWPGECRGAVSLTFDDGHITQLKRALPLLDDRELCGTFYIVPHGDDYASRLQVWQEPFSCGHEIGNHSLSHRCSRNFSPDPDAVGLETTTLDQLEADLLTAEQRLQELFPYTDGRSFAYPCYQTDVGCGLTRQSYVPVVARHFVAGRAVGEYQFFNNPVNIDLHCLVSAATEHMRAPEMIGLVELAVSRGHWVCFAFHSIDGGRLGIAESEFTLLLDHLVRNRERIWAAPVKTVAAAIRAGRRRLGIYE